MNHIIANKVYNGHGLYRGIDPYNPLNLPPNTVRVRTNNGNPPNGGTYNTATLVTGTTNVYDVYKSGNSFLDLLKNSNNVIEVLGANTTGIVSMSHMFFACHYLTTVALFDTSSVTDMSFMFNNCNRLTHIPLIDTSKVTNMNFMCTYCQRVESGAFALYKQASTQTNPPSKHTQTFRNCGDSSQIPSDWK